jgi:hypothetical protein
MVSTANGKILKSYISVKQFYRKQSIKVFWHVNFKIISRTGYNNQPACANALLQAIEKSS